MRWIVEIPKPERIENTRFDLDEPLKVTDMSHNSQAILRAAETEHPGV